MSFLTEHKDSCSPVKPCSNCQAVSFLRSKLGDLSFSEFIALLGEESGIPAIQIASPDTLLAELPEYRNLSERVRNCILNENLKTVEDLMRLTEAAALRMPNFGRVSLHELNGMLRSIGHRLGELPFQPRSIAS